jgi:formylglycine-generating enzyme required for sulfatase activity
VVSTSFAHVPGNKHVQLGSDAASHWGWDNEFPVLSTSVEAFAIRKTPITNAEFVPFVAAGGYERREFWSDDDWNWIQREQIRGPVHWVPNPASTSACLKIELRLIGKRGEFFLFSRKRK